MAKWLKQINIILIAGIIATVVLPLPAFAQTDSDGFNISVPVNLPDTPPGGGGGGSSRDTEAPIITNLIVEPDAYSAVLIWQTSEDALSQISWGETTDYSISVLTKKLYSKLHQTKIVGLKPNTIYYFKIVVQDNAGNQSVHEGSFSTLSLPDIEPPANVLNFRADVVNDQIRLSWENPTDSDFAGVRLVRSDRYYPLDPFNGQVIFEGTSDQFVDQSAVSGKLYYYTIFTRDTSNNFSSGSLASAIIRPGPGQAPFPPSQAPQRPFDFDLSLLDFDFSQNGKEISFTGTEIEIDGRYKLVITLPAEKIPLEVEAIVVDVFGTRGTGWRSSYLFTYERQNNRYIAVLPAFGRDGTFPIDTVFLDSGNNSLKKISASLIASIPGPEQPTKKLSIWWWLLLILILLLLLLWYERRRQKNAETQ